MIWSIKSYSSRSVTVAAEFATASDRVISDKTLLTRLVAFIYSVFSRALPRKELEGYTSRVGNVGILYLWLSNTHLYPLQLLNGSRGHPYVYGQLFSQGEIQTLELPDVPDEATHIEGIVETTYGDFVLSLMVREARKVIQSIKEYIAIKLKLSQVSEQLKSAESVYRVAKVRWRDKSITEGHQEAWSAVDDLRKQRTTLQMRVQLLEQLLRDY